MSEGYASYDQGLPSHRPFSQSGSLPYPEHFDSLPDHRSFRSPPAEYSSHDYDEPPRTRPRASSNLRPAGFQSNIPPPPPAKPIYDAVNDAFDHSSAANALPHDLIAQITEQVRSQVIDSLRAEGVGASHQQPQPQSSSYQEPQLFDRTLPGFGGSVHPASFTSAPQNLNGFPPYSPASTTSIPSRVVHTPPSPDKRSSLGSDFADDDFTFINGRMARQRKDNSGTENLSRAHTHEGFTEVQKPSDNGKVDLTGRYGDRTGDDTLHARPRAAARARTDEEETVVEKMWQPLFDADGHATPRLSQFLRGIALHLIEENEPKKSLVVTPPKMLQFYRATRIEPEPYDWDAVFIKSSPAVLSRIYRDMRAGHHFVQDTTVHEAHVGTDTPSIPALTPEGFATWMTLMIHADPKGEFDRLSHAVRDMPISNADDKKERFPKELSRRLLPRLGSTQARSQLEAALSTVGQSAHPRQGSYPPPPPIAANRAHRQSNAANERRSAARENSMHTIPSLERQRHPYSGPPGSDISSHDTRDARDSVAGTKASFTATVEDGSDHEDDDSAAGIDSKPSIQIERERKPYTAKEGAGKVHESEKAPFASSFTESPMDMHRDFRDVKGSRADNSDPTPHRSASVAVDGRGPSHAPSARPYDVDKTHHREPAHDNRGSHRNRSPIYNPGVRSDGVLSGYPEDYYTTRSTNPEQEGVRDREAGNRHKDRRDDDRYDRERERDRRYPDEQYRSRYDNDEGYRTGGPGGGSGSGGGAHTYHSSRHGSSVDPYGQASLGSGERRYG